MGLFNKNEQRTDGYTYDGQGDERVGMIDNVFYNLEKGVLLKRVPYDNLSTRAKVTVQDGQEMVFYNDGQYSDTFGPGSYQLSTNNVPFLQNLMNAPTGGNSAFKTTLYVISTSRQRLAGDEGGWGCGLTVRDYTYGDEGVTIKVGSYGSYEFRICNSRAFIKEYSGTQHEIVLGEFCNEFTSAVAQQVKPLLSQYFSKQKISITEANNYLSDIAQFVRDKLNDYFVDYGIELTKFDVEAINPDEDDEQYKRIIAAQTAGSEMDFESRARARARAREGYTYQQERQFDVMQGAAQNEGSAGQMMGAGMGIGMGFGMGGVFGQQMAGMANQLMNAQPVYGQPQQYGQPGQQFAQQAPPQMPQPLQMYVFVNNQQAGPFDMPVLQQMVQQGTLTPQTMVWKAGMPQWAAANTVPELASLFAQVPPPMPGNPPTPPTPPAM